MGTPKATMSPEIRTYYNALKAKNELTRSDVSIYPSFTHLKLPYRVVCRHRYSKNILKMRAQFIKEIRLQETLTSRALDGVRIHREFCNPVMSPALPSEIISLTKEEIFKLKEIMETNY